MRLSAAKCLSVLLTILTVSTFSVAAPKDIDPQLAVYARARVAEFAQIPAERKEELRKLAAYIRTQTAEKQDVKLLFICTHNSRRSHIAQIWAQTAAMYYGVDHIETFSGGTEVSAFNPRAVAALQRIGFDIKKISEGSNPLYEVRYSSSAEPLKAFSKIYDDVPNPTNSFAVIMTRANADKACPNVRGAALGVATHYDDPKAADGTPQESQVYDERVREISREVLYVFSHVRR
jgi:protein-tyrosine phosphatase/arsenate reductase